MTPPLPDTADQFGYNDDSEVCRAGVAGATGAPSRRGCRARRNRHEQVRRHVAQVERLPLGKIGAGRGRSSRLTFPSGVAFQEQAKGLTRCVCGPLQASRAWRLHSSERRKGRHVLLSHGQSGTRRRFPGAGDLTANSDGGDFPRPRRCPSASLPAMSGGSTTDHRARARSPRSLQEVPCIVEGGEQ